MKVSWDHYSQYMESHKIPWFQSPPTSHVFPGVQLDESFNWSFSRFPKKNPPTIPAVAWVQVLESLLAWLVPSDLWRRSIRMANAAAGRMWRWVKTLRFLMPWIHQKIWHFWVHGIMPGIPIGKGINHGIFRGTRGTWNFSNQWQSGSENEVLNAVPYFGHTRPL